jgi:hypothetical protein
MNILFDTLELNSTQTTIKGVNEKKNLKGAWALKNLSPKAKL